MRLTRLASVCVAVALCCLWAQTVSASFHFMQIEQVVGGVNGEAGAQAVQLRMMTAGQNQLATGFPDAPAKLVSYDSAGQNPVTLISFPSDVANGAAGRHVLIVTSAFADYVSPSLVSDFSMTAIPSGRLAAGRLTFETSTGGLLWSVE